MHADITLACLCHPQRSLTAAHTTRVPRRPEGVKTQWYPTARSSDRETQRCRRSACIHDALYVQNTSAHIQMYIVYALLPRLLPASYGIAGREQRLPSTAVFPRQAVAAQVQHAYSLHAVLLCDKLRWDCASMQRDNSVGPPLRSLLSYSGQSIQGVL